MAGCLLQMFTRFAATHVVPGLKSKTSRDGILLPCRACHALEHAGHVRIVREGIHQARSGLAPALIVRVGRSGGKACQAIYQEGLLISRYEAPEARPRRNAA